MFGDDRTLSVQSVDLNNGLKGTEQDRKEEHGAFGKETASRIGGSVEDRAYNERLCNLTEDDSTIEGVSKELEPSRVQQTNSQG